MTNPLVPAAPDDASPEDLQYILGIHPEQQAATQALVNAAQGNSEGFIGNDENPMIDRTGRVHESPVARPTSDASTNDEEEEEPKEGKTDVAIARPGGGPRGLNMPVISVPQPAFNKVATSRSDVDMPAYPEEPPKPDLAAAAEARPSIAGLIPSGPRPISQDQVRDQANQQTLSQDQARDQADQQKLDEMRAKGSGISRFQSRHHILGPILRGLEIAGTVVSPGTMAAIPGTTLNQRQKENLQEERVREDLGLEKEHAAEANREEVDTIRRQAEEDKRTQNEAMDKLRRDAETYKESMRDITYNPQTKQFMRGDQAYTPKDYQEGSMLEVQHGITTFGPDGKILNAGPYTAMWEREKRNQQPQTHIHNPSAEEEIYQDWRASFKRENGRDPNAKEINDFRRGGKGGAGEKDYTTLRKQIETDKENELSKGQAKFNKNFAQAKEDGDTARQDELTRQWDLDKSRIQGAYEAKLAQIPKGEQEPPERITGGKPQQPGAQKPAAGQGQKGAVLGGMNPSTKQPWKSGDPVMIDGKQMYVTGWNEQTKKPRVSAQQPQ